MFINILPVMTVPMGHLHYDIKVQRLVVVKLAGRNHTMNKIRIMEEDLPEVLINGSCENLF